DRGDQKDDKNKHDPKGERDRSFHRAEHYISGTGKHQKEQHREYRAENAAAHFNAHCSRSFFSSAACSSSSSSSVIEPVSAGKAYSSSAQAPKSSSLHRSEQNGRY